MASPSTAAWCARKATSKNQNSRAVRRARPSAAERPKWRRHAPASATRWTRRRPVRSVRSGVAGTSNTRTGPQQRRTAATTTRQRSGKRAATGPAGCGAGCRGSSSARSATGGSGTAPLLGVRHPSSEPGKQLPVAARPAMQPPGVGEIVRWIVLDQDRRRSPSPARPCTPSKRSWLSNAHLGNSAGKTSVRRPRHRRSPCRCRRPRRRGPDRRRRPRGCTDRGRRRRRRASRTARLRRSAG